MNPDTSVLPVGTNDHDLLIQLNTQMHSLTTEVRGYNANVATQIQDHETRLRTVETEIQQTKGAARSLRNYLNVVVAIGTALGAVATILTLLPHR